MWPFVNADRPTYRCECTPSISTRSQLAHCKWLFNNCRLKVLPCATSVPTWIASYATHGAGAMVWVNIMRIPSFGRRITIGRASILWPGAS